MTAQTPKIRSKWWYLIPFFLGVIGSVITWFALKSYDKKLARNCLVLGVILDVVKIIIFASLVSFENFNLITEF